MITSELILLSFILSIDSLGAINAESLITGNSEELENEDLLIDFMTDVKTNSLEKLGFYHLMVMGKNKNYLQTTKVVLETYTPYYIATEADAATIPFINSGANSVVLYFIDGISGPEINSTFAGLPKNYDCKMLIISLEKSTTMESINKIVFSADKTKLKNISFASFDGKVIKIYRRYSSLSCREEVIRTNTWTRKRGFKTNHPVIGLQKKNLDLRRCPLIVSTFNLLPTMLLKKESNSWKMLGGMEAGFIETIADHANGTAVITPPSTHEKYWEISNGSVLGIIGMVANEVAHIGIGQIRPTLNRKKIVDFTTDYNPECIVWTVPLIQNYDYSLVVSEFSCQTWALVILSVLLCCILAWANRKLDKYGGTFLDVLDVISISMRYAVPRNPSGFVRKFFFLIYLNYSQVITTAYVTSLASILTATMKPPSIVDEEGILSWGLRTGGTSASREILNEQISPNTKRAELLNRYEVMRSSAIAVATFYSNRKDLAYLRHLSTVDYITFRHLRRGEPVEFYPLRSTCVLSYSSVMVTAKGSYLTSYIDHIINRLLEAGIQKHWNNAGHTGKLGYDHLQQNYDTLSELRSIFYLYLGCLVPAFLAFAIELMVFKKRTNSFTR